MDECRNFVSSLGKTIEGDCRESASRALPRTEELGEWDGCLDACAHCFVLLKRYLSGIRLFCKKGFHNWIIGAEELGWRTSG